MKVLLDTNIIIHREASRIFNVDIGVLFRWIDKGKYTNIVADYKNIEYMIGGKAVKLENGLAETDAAPGSSTKIVTRYFGNELKSDLNNDDREDIAFLLTQETGGSGIFFYVVVALNTKEGYVGSDGYFLGDRIAPQTTELSQNLKQNNVIVINYADRPKGSPMTDQPSVGKSVYLKFDPETMHLDLRPE